MLFVSILLLALTRADVLERFKAAPITKVDGLVRVIADCPADMRREFQEPVASFVADVCRTLYRADNARARKFDAPGIVVYVGDVRTNVAEVVVKPKTRADGTVYTRIYLPAPAYSDVAKLRRETVKAFYLAVKGEAIDDAAAEKALRAADPALRIADEYAAIANWLEGGPSEGDDERYLEMMRSVLDPGVAYKPDVLRFASRLFFYPEVYGAPFCGRYDACTFQDAITLAAHDLRIRFLAIAKSSQVVAWGGGHGDELLAAAEAYSEFLRELAVFRKTPDELRALLDAADAKLKVAFDAAR